LERGDTHFESTRLHKEQFVKEYFATGEEFPGSVFCETVDSI